jgi:transposase
MKPYSMDLRERVVAACEAATDSKAEVAKRFNVSVAWVKKLLQRKRESGSIAALPQRSGRKPLFAGASLERLKAAVQETPDATLQELLKKTGVAASIMAAQRALKRLDCRRKKSLSTPASKSARTSKRGVKSGARKRASLSGLGWSSLTRAAPKRT